MRSKFTASIILVLLFATPLLATDPTKWDPNKMQISSPVVRNWSWDYSDFGKAVRKWLDTQSEADGVECDKLADKLMADYKDNLAAYVVASELANLRGNKDKAIELMRLAVEKFPVTRTIDGRVKLPKGIDARLPLPLFAHLHIAAYAKQAGDLATARQEYEKAIEELADIQQEEKNVTTAICHLYIAEIDVAQTGKTDALSQRIKLIRELTPPVISDEERQLFPDSDTPFEIIVKWADYQLVKKTQGAEASYSKCKQPDDEVFGMFIESHLVSSGLNGGQLGPKVGNVIKQRVIDHSESELDKDTVLLFRGHVYEHQKDYTAAEKYYNILLQEESFLSPSGGAGLVRCKKLQGKDAEAEAIKKQLKLKYRLIKFE
jgi:tetratricopeptide (TPR) repeat protein